MGKYVVKGIIVLFGFAFLFAVYWFGEFSESFSTNLCYSEVLSTVRDQIDNAVKTGNKEDLLKVKKMVDRLPLQGYESNCNEIRNATKNL